MSLELEEDLPLELEEKTEDLLLLQSLLEYGETEEVEVLTLRVEREPENGDQKRERTEN